MHEFCCCAAVYDKLGGDTNAPCQLANKLEQISIRSGP